MNEGDFLKNISKFAGLTDEEIKNMMKIMKKVKFPVGSSIIQEGDTGDSMYIIMDGSVEVSKTLAMKISGEGFEEKEKKLTRLNVDDYAVFGEVVLLEDDIRTASAVAVSDCIL